MFYTEEMKIVTFILLMLATNPMSERNAHLRLKNMASFYNNLNWCMLLHIHKEKTDAL